MQKIVANQLVENKKLWHGLDWLILCIYYEYYIIERIKIEGEQTRGCTLIGRVGKSCQAEPVAHSLLGTRDKLFYIIYWIVADDCCVCLFQWVFMCIDTKWQMAVVEVPRIRLSVNIVTTCIPRVWNVTIVFYRYTRHSG